MSPASAPALPRLFVLDAMGLAYRAYYAFIRRPLVTSRGENTSAIHGFANTLLKIRREEWPDYWALAWDGRGPTMRHERYPEYKAHRKPMPDELLAQMPVLAEVAEALAIPVLQMAGVEADDIMATLAVRGAAEPLDVALVTSDKDLLQLVGDRVRLLSPSGKGEDYAWVDRAAVIDKWGEAPEQIRDVLALMGDASDNVPGVPGVGEKTAVELISKFGSLEALYDRLGEVGRDALREKLATHRDLALLSRDLVTVRTDCDLPVAWEDLRRVPVHVEALRALAERYELQRLLRVVEELRVAEPETAAVSAARSSGRDGGATATAAPRTPPPFASSPPPVARAEAPTLASPPPSPPFAPSVPPAPPSPSRPVATSAPPPPAPYVGPAAQATLDLWGPAEADVTLDQRIERLHAVRARSLHGIAVLPYPDRDDETLVGLALAARDGTTCYVPLAHDTGPNLSRERAREWLAPMLADPHCAKIGVDLKRDLHRLERVELTLDGLAFDLHIGSFLCDPVRDHTLAGLARDVLGIALPSLDAPSGGRTRWTPGAVSVAAAAAAMEPAVGALFPIAQALRSQLEAREQWALYESLEHPLIAVLYDMERTGILVDREVLARLAEHLGADIARLEAELTALAGEPFNLNSGPQIARILFEKLGLKTGRRTKTGFSTDQAVLEELAGSHPFPARLLEYRVLSKLKSTYLDTLPEVMDPRDHRIHTTFNQAGAATGRLSSSAPNLQNIPLRTAQGREIRRAFIAPPDGVLVGADYSQIELRVMAHLSGDPHLIEAFRSGEDIHASTARRIFNLTGDIDPTLRARAKIVNFGIMYGMGARSLAQQMGIGLPEAQQFIAHYFRLYARVRDFLDATLVDARRQGYVATLFGRRRYLPGLQSLNGGERSLAERVAINTPIQGSAADLMKLAMARVHVALMQWVPSARLLLQVHDELLLECAAGDAEAASRIVREKMEGGFDLKVPLEVSVGRGPTWLDVH